MDRISEQALAVSHSDMKIHLDEFSSLAVKSYSIGRTDLSSIDVSFKIVNNGVLDRWYNIYDPSQSYFSLSLEFENDYLSTNYEQNQKLYQLIGGR
jgi:hypothetical protein